MEIAKRKEHVSIHRISDEQLFAAIQCPGFLRMFDTSSVDLPKTYEARDNPASCASYIARTGTIVDVQGCRHALTFVRDLDNAGVMVHHPETKHIELKLILRDRSHDGSVDSTPPGYLKVVHDQNTETNVPERSKKIGVTSWYYASPNDTVVSGRTSVEFSIISSDPQALVIDKLNGKKDRLPVSPESLALFIDDPFAVIPFDDPSNEKMNVWWKHWYQVVQRGIRGKAIPYPGQTAQKGFQGFFNHTVASLKNILPQAGYTHLCGVPTWYYVWNLNMETGFQPDDLAQHQEALSFFDRLHSVRIDQNRTIRETNLKQALVSWFAIAPFAMERRPDFLPFLDVRPEYAAQFSFLFRQMQEAFLVPQTNNVVTYPLSPGRNLWHSLALS